MNNKESKLVPIGTLLKLLAMYGGKIISSKDVLSDEINLARETGRMYVDDNSLGYVWIPYFKHEIPTTDLEVSIFEKYCMYGDEDLPEKLSVSIVWKSIQDRILNE